MTLGLIFGVGGAGFLCGVSVMYLVMMRTYKKRLADLEASAPAAA
jgi:hypothetical protein